eukprot:FR736394.1.p1 GENE.FR736394.1~~FR736394.1.p1  ORF type:complete len:143 (+),score=6.94 FR736394.1:109-537(+)
MHKMRSARRSVSAPLGWSLTRSDRDLPIDDLIEEYMKDGGGGVGKGGNGMDDNGDAIHGGINLTRLSPVRAVPDERGSRAVRCNEAGAGKRSPKQQHSATDPVALGAIPVQGVSADRVAGTQSAAQGNQHKVLLSPSPSQKV